MRPSYRLIVGNIGTVYEGPDRAEADRLFDLYVDQSKRVNGCRAYGEDVTLFEDDEIIREHYGHLQNNDI